MPTAMECACCHQQEKVKRRSEQQPGITCITEHDGFSAVCQMNMYFRLRITSTGSSTDGLTMKIIGMFYDYIC